MNTFKAKSKMKFFCNKCFRVKEMKNRENSIVKIIEKGDRKI